MNFGLITYGKNSQSKGNILKSVYRQVVRTTTYAFRTRLINNIIIEADVLILQNRAYELKAKIMKKLLSSGNSILGEDAKKSYYCQKNQEMPNHN